MATTPDAIRRRAVRAVEDEQRTQSDVARMLGVTRASVSAWVRRYREHGEEALQSRPRGRSRKTGTNDDIASRLVTRLLDPPESRGLWDNDLVRAELEERCGVTASRWTVGRYLAEWDLVPTDVARRLREEIGNMEQWGALMGALRDHAKSMGSLLFRLDLRVTAWRAAGAPTSVQRGGPGKPVHLFSATGGRYERSFLLSAEEPRSETWIDFLERLRGGLGRPVLAVAAGLSFADAPEVQQWLAQRANDVRVVSINPKTAVRWVTHLARTTVPQPLRPSS